MIEETAARFETVRAWFGKARDNAEKMGRRDSAALWADGLYHLEQMRALNSSYADALKQALDFIESITDAAGPYPFANNTDLVCDAFAVASKIRATLAINTPQDT